MLALRQLVRPAAFSLARPALAEGRSLISVTRKMMYSSSSTDDEHREETYEEYTDRYVKFFSTEADDVFELSRGLANAFNTDIVPAPEVLVAAMKCARKLNSYPLASRTMEALKEKLETEDKKVYEQYLTALRPTLEELGVATPEEIGR
eukprot:Partr_v1_DN28485_c0_g1_i4_m41364 putative cytoChrome c oxidase subunit